MSDSIEELSREYTENVLEEHARSVGLFTIPEYPEFEQRGMWSTALDVILTTLRYIAPATLLTIFWGQQSFLFKFLKYIDSTFRALVFSNEEQKQAVLEWLIDAGPVRVDDLDVVWRYGWILCGVLDTALPGACAGHPPTRLPLKHAQAIADHYLGVEPVFTRQELELNDSISRIQRWKLVNYLDSIRLAIAKVAPSALKSSTQKSSPETLFTLNYIARGSGLTVAQVNNKVYFKIYPTAQQSIDPGDINILIHGPKNTYGMTVLPPILGKAQLIRQNLLGLQSKSSYTENVLPITQGTTYLRHYGANNMNKTFYISKTKYDIDIETEVMQDHAKIGYVANLEGKYEISITSRGQNVVGSPFMVTASKNVIEILERDNFCLEDGEEIDILDVKTDKKVVLRIVDFVSEKMLLKDNGCLEKITEEEAKLLIEKDHAKNRNEKSKASQEHEERVVVNTSSKSRKFYNVTHKVLILNRVCKLFVNLPSKRKHINQVDMQSVNKKHIPDIVNSTISEDSKIMKNYVVPEKRDRIIVPEKISVSILTEKSKLQEAVINSELTKTPNILGINSLDVNYNTLVTDPFEDDNMSVDTVQSSNNPFLNDVYDQHYAIAKQFGSFIPNEYESNNSQNEETENANMKLFKETQGETAIETTNPFIDIANIERPKTPVCKIITGEITDREDCGYIDTENQTSIDEISSEYLNPFVDQDQSEVCQDKPDFIIGAPVSLPPLINIASSTPTSKTNIEIKNNSINNIKSAKGTNNYDATKTAAERKTSNNLNNSNSYNSLDSNLTEDVIITPNSSPTPSNVSHLHSSREMSPRKDTWDSAYVSIDDNNSSENNTNEPNSDTLNKRKSQISHAFSRMGPAEKELLQNEYSDLRSVKNLDDELKPHKFEIKRLEIMPILEESEKSITSGMKDKTFNDKMLRDSVTEAFSDINDIYDDLFTNSEVSSVTTTHENQSQNLGIDYTVEDSKPHVDSASEFKADVKRQTKLLEGKISEIQAKVTESISASRNLRARDIDKEENNNTNNTQVQFGDHTYTNIVLEKKRYWDEKIRQVEANSEEVKSQHLKKRSRHLRRNDSLSKKRGKKIIQNFLNTSQDECERYTKSSASLSNTIESQNDIEVIKTEILRKDDEDTTKQNETTTCFGLLTKNKEHPLIETLKQIKVSSDVDTSTVNEDQKYHSNLQLKQELSEKVFQAFETSPKRFFGTSRKHILNKIDTFLGLPENEKEQKKVIDDVSHESGLVSSRISLFHTISQTEELPWARRKCKSMYNIARQDSEKCIYSDSKNEQIKDSVDLVDKENSHTSIDHLQGSPLKVKRARLTQNMNNRTYDETIYTPSNNYTRFNISSDYVKKTIKDLNKQNNDIQSLSSQSKLKSISKSEMDIFNKVTATTIGEDFEKHKSYEELPKISVKNFITLYEDVSKSTITSPRRSVIRSNSVMTPKKLQISSSNQGTANKMSASVVEIPLHVASSSKNDNDTFINRRRKTLSKDKSFEILSNDSAGSSFDFEIISNQDKDPNYLSLSDVEIEIIDKEPEPKVEPLPETETAHIEYKNRFTMAKKYFQSLEELREEKKVKKLTKQESLSSQSIESLEETKPRKRNNIKKSRSMPSSEIAKIWNQMQEEKESESKKFVKISEKFNVDDLFEDVMEGRLSRQGSLRGIPHKKAVLETFRSMENVSDNKLNSYEMAVSQLNDFANENKIKNAQTYLSEYPYLPTTDPSKYHSRLDANATGLITLKELKRRPRRNSVPDLRLNPSFTADL